MSSTKLEHARSELNSQDLTPRLLERSLKSPSLPKVAAFIISPVMAKWTCYERKWRFERNGLENVYTNSDIKNKILKLKPRQIQWTHLVID